MRKMLVILLLVCCTSPVLADTFVSAGWVYGQDYVSYVITFQCSSPGCWYKNYYLGYYPFSSGSDWQQMYYAGNCAYTADPEASVAPYRVTYSYLIGWCGAWNGDISSLLAGNELELAKAQIAKDVFEGGHLPSILNFFFPDGPDPSLEQLLPTLIKDASIVDALASLFDMFLPHGGDPVYLTNGEYDLSVTDLQTMGRVLPVGIRRNYGSRREYNSRFGFGWDMNYNMKVRWLSTASGDPDVVMLLDGNNARRLYSQDASDPNLYVRQYNLNDYLYDTDGLLTLVKKSGVEYEFDANGNLSTITDRNGNLITFTYDPNGLQPVYGRSPYFDPEYAPDQRGLVAQEHKLTAITDDLGRLTTFTYDADGLLATVTDFADRTWTYTHDPNTNDLLSVEDPNGLVTSYAYDYGDNLVSITDPNGQTYVENIYDGNDMVVEQLYGYGTFEFAYDANNSETSLIDREGYETRTTYSELGQTLSETVYTADPNAEPNAFTTQHFYDPNTRERTRTIYPNGTCVDYTYDALANLTGVYRKISPADANSASDPNVIATTFTYDSAHVYDINSITDPEGNTTTFAYDPNGNVTSITYPAVPVHGYAQPQAPVVQYTYNGAGQVDTMTAPDGIVTKYYYYSDSNPNDPNAGKLWKTVADYNEVDGFNITTEYAYDTYGNIREITDPNGDVMQMTYNELNLLTKTVSPLGHVTLFEYNPNKKVSQIEREIPGPNQVTSFTYDILDHVKTTTDSLGHVTTFGYTKSEEPNLVTDAESNSTISVYNERGLLVKVIDANDNDTNYAFTLNGDVNDVNDANGNVTSYTYDAFDRLTYITYPDDSYEAFTYDKNSNLLSKTSRAGETTYFEYDGQNRLLVKDGPNDPNITYTYDIAGRVYDVNDGGAITEYYYDRIGRMTDVNDPADRLVSYDYDDRGLRTKLTYPDATYITYEYDAEARLRRIKDDSNDVLAEYSYDDLSRRTLLTLGNDANAVYEYDLANRLKLLTNNIDDTNSIVFDYNDYDAVGNRLSLKIDDANEQTFTYDNLYQLITVDYNDGNMVDYYYDPVGNRTSVVDTGTTSYTANSLNQYTAVGATSYTYDDNGNLAYDGLYRYYYDDENRLTDVNDASDDPIASYVYDYRGRRIERTVYGTPDVTTKYAYDGDRVIAEYDGSGTLLRKFVYGPGIDEPICMVDVADANETYFYHFDGLGSVVALSDVNNVLVERYAYDVFGQPTIRDVNGTTLSASAVANPYLFTGRRYDAEAGLYYYRARYYDFATARFLQPDPLGYADSLNVYAYVVNNPVNYLDPLGERFVVSGPHKWAFWVAMGYLYVCSDSEHREGISEMVTTKKATFYIETNNEYSKKATMFEYDMLDDRERTAHLNWNPFLAGWGYNADTQSGVVQTPAMALWHELMHYVDWTTNRGESFGLKWSEQEIIELGETPMARALGEGVRTQQEGSFFYPVSSPLSTAIDIGKFIDMYFPWVRKIICKK